MKPKIVVFKDGRFGVRRGSWIGYEFLDMQEYTKNIGGLTKTM